MDQIYLTRLYCGLDESSPYFVPSRKRELNKNKVGSLAIIVKIYLRPRTLRPILFR